MPKQDDHRRAASDRVLPLRARGDLEVIEVQTADQSTYVVKDPVAGEAFHLSAEEHALLVALRDPASLKELQRLIETRFAPRRAPILDLQQFVNTLYEQGLVVGDNPGQGAELAARGAKRTRSERWASLLSILAIRLGSLDAGPFVDRLYRVVGWMCSPLAVIGLVAFMLAAAVMAVGSAPELAARLPGLAELAAPRRLPLWIALVAGVKVLHELGHATACRHFGARPKEIGVLLLAGAPSMYCDVSDAWRLPSKWQRIAVSSAGMFVELAIAAAAIVVWSYAQPGLVANVALSLVIVCSVGTLMVNANPLLRYDGYYLLSDWMEVPNLSERARGLVSAAWRRWLLGEKRQDDPLLSPHKRRALWAYAILAKAYLAMLLVGLFLVFHRLARPYHLENAVYSLAAVVLASIAARPVVAMAKLAANPAVRARFRWLRLAATLLVLGGLVAGVLVLPLKDRVTAPLVIVPAHTHPLFAIASGELKFAMKAGAEVKPGDVVVRLRNSELELALAQAEAKVRELGVRLEHLRLLQSSLPNAARMLPAAAAELADAQAQLKQQRTVADSLVVRAPAAGLVLAPPDRPVDNSRPDKLRPWHGSTLDERNVGAWIEAGTPLAVVAEPEGRIAWAAVNQEDVTAVEQGQTVRILADSRPMEILTGRVTDVARRARRNNPAAASAQPAGDASGASYHVVELQLDPPDASRAGATPLLPAARGTAKIAAHESTVGAVLLNELRQTFQRVF